ncbi:MAG: heavy metal translocating P-type ATPase [Chloroflexota bacterium]
MLAEIVLGGITLHVGTKVYNRKKKRKKLIDNFSYQIGQEPQLIRSQSATTNLQSAIPTFIHKRINLLRVNSRREHLKKSSSAVETSSNQVVRKLFVGELVVSATALGLATAGIVYPIFSLLSLPFVMYRTVWLVIDASQKLLLEHRVTIDTLVMMNILTGLALGTSAIFSSSGLILALVTLNLFLSSWSRKLIAQIRYTTKSSLIDIFKQKPDFAWLYKDGVEVLTDIEKLGPGDIVVVNAGDVIPVDGRIVEGLASIDQRMLTGEAQPAEKGAGESVFALTMIMSGKIHICVEKTGEETTAAQIGQILNQTINFKTGMQLWVEDISNRSVIPTLAVYSVLLPTLGPQSALAVLVGHPKFKTTVASYLSVLSYFNLASKNGILIKDGLILELLNEVDTVVFDKTGTLTEEQPHIGQIFISKGYTEDDILTYAAAAEYRQTHPVALAILQAAHSRGLEIPDIDEAAYKVGYGLTVTIGVELIRLGSIRFIQEEKLFVPPEITKAQEICHEQGHSLVLVAINDEVAGAIALQPTIRPEAQAVINGLRKHGMQSMYIISGDHETPTRMLANELNIDHYFAETLPENKADLIERLQNDGKTVCYIGDGINDSIALKKAAVSVSLRGASSVATDTAQVILMDGNLTKLSTLFELADRSERNMKQTFSLVLVPHLISLGGILFLHFGLASAIILSQLGLALGVVNAMRPRLQSEDEIIT